MSLLFILFDEVIDIINDGMERLHTTNFKKKYKPQTINNNNKPTNPRNSTIPKMRTSKNMRLMSTDLKRLQKSIK